MPRRPEPLQTTRLLGAGLFLWLLDVAVVVWDPQPTSRHLGNFIAVVETLCLYGGLVFLLTGMFLRASSWTQAWRDGTDEPYQAPGDVRVSERQDYPAEDDPDF